MMIMFLVFLSIHTKSYGASIHRISGSDRYETAIQIGGNLSSDKVILVHGASFADATSAGPFAAWLKAPIFLSNGKIDYTDRFLERGVQEVYIIGGERVIGQEEENRLQENFKVKRIAGKNRFETSLLLNQEIFPEGGGLGFATGLNFPDALTAGAFLGRKGLGLQLVSGVEEFPLPEDMEVLYTFGGRGVLPVDHGERIAGKNRFDTAYQISQKLAYENIILASGASFPDALAATPLAVVLEAPIVLTERDILPEETKTALKKAKNIYVVGGQGVISQKVLEDIYKEEPVEEPVKPPTIRKENGLYWVGNTLIVNKTYPLPKDYNPGISSSLLRQFEKMRLDAAKAGHRISIGSGFRSYSYQLNLYEGYKRRLGEEAANRISAKQGHSEHQTGLAIDVKGSSCYLDQRFGNTPEGKWLAANAHKYGFHLRYPKGKEAITGYSYEPWHFRYLGVDLATDLYKKGLTVEEYFGL